MNTETYQLVSLNKNSQNSPPHRFYVNTLNQVPNMTPYHSSYPINSIFPVDNLDPNLTHQKKYIKEYPDLSIGLPLAPTMVFLLRTNLLHLT